MTIRSSISTLALSLLFALPVLAQPTGTLQTNEDRLQGTHPSGHVLLFSPDPVQPGSSISHWDPTATPNLLMEPAINADLPFLGLDLTPAQMMDIGWSAGTSAFQIIAADGGFFDPTPFPGAPGNPATTLGEARVNLFSAVLGAWADALDSDVPVDVIVVWTPLTCIEGQGAVLAAAGTTVIFREDPRFPLPGTWFHAALAEALAGEDLTGSPAEGGGDIIVFMNSDIDLGCLGPGTSYYYGLDGNQPPNQVDVAPVVLHEVGHGLGFANFTDERDGELIQGFPSIYDVFTLDEDTGKLFSDMSDAERVAAAKKPFDVTWTGANVTDEAQDLLEPGVPELVVTGGGAANGTYAIGTASFGPPIPDAGLTAPIACLRDGVPDASSFNGCTKATNEAELAGRIALIDRGACAFTTKVANAQAAGAVGAIIVNNAGQTPLGLGGTDPSITIPAVSVGAGDGQRIREATCPGATASLGPGGRIQVEAHWATATDSGPATAHPLTSKSEFFTFFQEDNPELVVKVINACGPFDRFWVFAAGLTNVEVTLTVTDTQTGFTKIYTNPLGTAFQPIQDTSAFATCP
jgi:hypothetical protein